MTASNYARIAVYAGSFDPPTLGHEWVIKTASKMFDWVVVAIGINPEKNPMFSAEERRHMLMSIVRNMGLENVSVDEFENQFLIDFAKQNDAGFLVRGMRNAKDFEDESNLRLINEHIDPSIETVYLMPPHNMREIASSNVKNMYKINGWERVASDFVSDSVLTAMINKNAIPMRSPATIREAVAERARIVPRHENALQEHEVDPAIPAPNEFVVDGVKYGVSTFKYLKHKADVLCEFIKKLGDIAWHEVARCSGPHDLHKINEARTRLFNMQTRNSFICGNPIPAQSKRYSPHVWVDNTMWTEDLYRLYITEINDAVEVIKSLDSGLPRRLYLPGVTITADAAMLRNAIDAVRAQYPDTFGYP